MYTKKKYFLADILTHAFNNIIDVIKNTCAINILVSYLIVEL